MRDYIGKKLKIIMDRPLGSRHPEHDFLYEVNYGYLPDTTAPDGEEIDAYFLGVDYPLQQAEGICIAIVHRLDDDDDKLIIVPEGMTLSNEEIFQVIHFTEKWFQSIIIR